MVQLFGAANKHRSSSGSRNCGSPAKTRRANSNRDDEPVERMQLFGASEDEEQQQISEPSQPGEHVPNNQFIMPKCHEVTDIDNVLGSGLVQGDSSQTTTSDIKDTISLSQLALDQIDNIGLMTCGSDDITSYVPMSLKQNVWKNQYINIALLLKGISELIGICPGGYFRLNEKGILV